MDEKRDEIYERIPWETLEKSGNDRQWWVMGVAAAVVAGALGYSFVSNRAVSPPPAPAAVAEAPTSNAPAPPAPAPATPATTSPAPAEVQAPAAPRVVAEADLFAVPPDALRQTASAHAEWFVSEYLTSEGADGDDSLLRTMLPADLPLPASPDGTMVFVEWVVATEVVESAQAVFEVEVLARYLVAKDGGPYQRVAPEVFTVTVLIDDAGPRIASAPRISSFAGAPSGPMGLAELPPATLAAVAELRPGVTVLGGQPNADGSWTVSVVSIGPGDVARPESLLVGP